MRIRSILLFAPAKVQIVAADPVACAIAMAKADAASPTIFCEALDVTTAGLRADNKSLAAAILGRGELALAERRGLRYLQRSALLSH